MESIIGVHNQASEILVKTNGSVPQNIYIDRLRMMGIEKEQPNVWMDFINYISGLTQTFDIISGQRCFRLYPVMDGNAAKYNWSDLGLIKWLLFKLRV